MAYFRCGSGGGTKTVSAYGRYTNGSTINCNKGDLLVFACNDHRNPTGVNLNLLCSGDAFTSLDTVKVYIYTATSTSCSFNTSLYNGSIFYAVIS